MKRRFFMKRIVDTIALIIVYLFIYIFSQFLSKVLIAAFAAFLFRLFLSLGTQQLDKMQTILFMKTSLTNNDAILLIVSGLIAFRIIKLINDRRNESMVIQCNFSKIKLKFVCLLIVLGIALNFFIVSVVNYYSLSKLSPNYSKLMNDLLGGELVLTLIGIGIIVPFYEELLYRGLIFYELKKSFSLTMSVIIQAVIFAASHFNLTQGIYCFAIAVIFAVVYTWFKSIFASVVVHASINCTSIIGSRMLSEDVLKNNATTILTTSCLVSIICFILMSKLVKNDSGKVNT